MQSEGVEPHLEGTQVEGAMGPGGVVVGGWLGEEGG